MNSIMLELLAGETSGRAVQGQDAPRLRSRRASPLPPSPAAVSRGPSAMGVCGSKAAQSKSREVRLDKYLYTHLALKTLKDS